MAGVVEVVGPETVSYPDLEKAGNESSDKKYRASSAVTLKTLSAWEQACLSAWYSPRFWLDLLIHPSPEYKMNHVRRRARLFALVSLSFLAVSVVANSIAYRDGHDPHMLGVHLLSNLLMVIAYAMSRTKHATFGKSVGVFAVWLLPYVSGILNLRLGNSHTGDVTVTDSLNWLFTPAWYLLAAIFLSRSMTISVILFNAFALFVMPAIAGATFYQVRKLFFFHMVNGILLLLASVISFRDKLQLYSQQDGQVHQDQHRASAFARFIVQPHRDVTDRIFRRRARILSSFLLGLIPFSLIWTCLEASSWTSGVYDGTLVGIALFVFFSSIILYGLSRTPYTRWASRLTIFMLLVLPYLYQKGPTATAEGELYANLITVTASAILGVTLLSGPELVALSAIIFFFNLYSPLFPPHIVLSLILLAAALVFRRDIKEIHDTAFHREDLYEDESGDLLIPWEKKYFFNLMSYIEMVIAYYAVGFSLLILLGLTAVIATATAKDTLTSPAVEVQPTPRGASPYYVLFVSTGDCPSQVAQTYTIVGDTGRIRYVNPIALKAYSTATIPLTSSRLIGRILETGFALGDKSFDLSQSERCVVNSIEVWDNVMELSYSSNLGETQDTTAPKRRLLGNDYTFSSQYFNSFLDILSSRENFRVSTCPSLEDGQSHSMFVWARPTCNLSPQLALVGLQLCSYLGQCTQEEGCCSGHGSCYVDATENPSTQVIWVDTTLACSSPADTTPYCIQPNDIFYGLRDSETGLSPVIRISQGSAASNCAADSQYCATCQCDSFYSGSLCEVALGSACGYGNGSTPAEALGIPSYNGQCNQLPPNDFEQGSYGTLLSRGTVPAAYVAPGVVKIDDSAGKADDIAQEYLTATRTGASNYPMNMWALGMMELAMDDIARVDHDPFNIYEYGGLDDNEFKLYRAVANENTGTSWVGSAATATVNNPTAQLFPVPAQYSNVETGWVDLSPIYTVLSNATKRDNCILKDSNPVYLDEAKILGQSRFQNSTFEFKGAMRGMIAYHNYLAKLQLVYFCGPDVNTPLWDTCTLPDPKTNIFEIARLGTIRFFQYSLVTDVLPSIFYPTDPPAGQGCYNPLGEDSDGGNTITDLETLITGLQFPTLPGSHMLTAATSLLNTLRTPVDETGAASFYIPAFDQDNIDECTTFAQENGMSVLFADRTDLQRTVLYLQRTAAQSWGNAAQASTINDLRRNTEFLRDLGVGTYNQYVEALLGSSEVLSTTTGDLLLGAFKDTRRTTITWGFSSLTSDMPKTVIALTAGEIFKAIKKDRFSVLTAPDVGPVDSIYRRIFDGIGADPTSGAYPCWSLTQPDSPGYCTDGESYAWYALAPTTYTGHSEPPFMDDMTISQDYFVVQAGLFKAIFDTADEPTYYRWAQMWQRYFACMPKMGGLFQTCDTLDWAASQYQYCGVCQ